MYVVGAFDADHGTYLASFGSEYETGMTQQGSCSVATSYLLKCKLPRPSKSGFRRGIAQYLTFGKHALILSFLPAGDNIYLTGITNASAIGSSKTVLLGTFCDFISSIPLWGWIALGTGVPIVLLICLISISLVCVCCCCERKKKTPLILLRQPGYG